MENLFENQFIRICFDIENDILHNIWLPETIRMEDSTYQTMALTQIKYMQEVRTSRWLVDLSQLKYVVTPEIQEWADAIFPEVLAAGIKHIAFVNSPDLFTQISVEQLMEEKNVVTANFEIHYFVDTEKAVEWLKTM